MNSIIKTGFFLLVSLLCFNFPASYAFEVTDDVTGANDSQFFKRYPRSKIDDFKQGETADYLLALGAPKNVNGLMRLEYSERLAGMLTRITYRAPDNESSQQVFDHFRSQINGFSYRLLFECHDRECGDSNEWANRIFEISKLYGPDRYQHYLAVQLNTDNGPVFVVIYTIQRGNKRVYTQLDLLVPKNDSTLELVTNPDTILSILESDGVFHLRNLQFDNNDTLTADGAKRMVVVVRALANNTRIQLYVVGHVAGSESVDILKARSLRRAESVVQALTAQGVRSDRLIAQGVGPLAPIRQNSDDANRVALIIR